MGKPEQLSHHFLSDQWWSGTIYTQLQCAQRQISDGVKPFRHSNSALREISGGIEPSRHSNSALREISG